MVTPAQLPSGLLGDSEETRTKTGGVVGRGGGREVGGGGENEVQK